jgi:hypothetical protein
MALVIRNGVHAPLLALFSLQKDYLLFPDLLPAFPQQPAWSSALCALSCSFTA